MTLIHVCQPWHPCRPFSLPSRGLGTSLGDNRSFGCASYNILCDSLVHNGVLTFAYTDICDQLAMVYTISID